jgi:4-hydroxythreonine-4-phosphate dehydrogenase
MGDPAGIGPEIIVRALHERPNYPVRVFGDPLVLARAASRLGLAPPPKERIEALSMLEEKDLAFGQPNLASARAQFRYLEVATTAALEGRIAALCTAPISKSWMARVGFSYPGHTEYLAARAGNVDVGMMLAGPALRVTVATTHVALRDIPRLLTPATIARVAFLTTRALAEDFGLERPRVAIAGLNPHAGEEGRFGDEEERIVRPALDLARAELAAAGIEASLTGPHVPDVVFRAAASGAHDAVIALYHDQGLIPVKLLHFDDAVNVTLGLPFVRTSPDHGTAYDIAGTGHARATSFLAALDMASSMRERLL